MLESRQVDSPWLLISFAAAIGQILLLDAVFSIDSIITAGNFEHRNIADGHPR